MRSDGTVVDDDFPTFDDGRAGDPSARSLRSDLPPGIENQVVEYVRTEFGEHEGMPDALKASDLVYVGAVAKGSKMVHFWRVPSAHVERWAAVTIDGAESYFDLTTTRPPI